MLVLLSILEVKNKKHMDKKTFRAFVRFKGKLKVMYVRAEDLRTALTYILDEAGVAEVINISQEDDTVIL